MRLLLDENIPKRLKGEFAEHEIYTVADKGWTGKSNGELLRLLIENQIDVLLTFDKNLQHQQNFRKFSIPVLVLNTRNNTFHTLVDLVPKIKAALKGRLPVGVTEIS